MKQFARYDLHQLAQVGFFDDMHVSKSVRSQVQREVHLPLEELWVLRQLSRTLPWDDHGEALFA